MHKTIAFLLITMIFALPALSQSPEEDPWWRDRVFYEIFIRSFYDSDGDGIGDLHGIIEKLDYLNDGDPTTTDDLGITGIWLMPPAQSPSYHGYDVTNYREIESDYGTNEDFLQLVEEAHKRGIAVIVDLVVNHTSNEHPWFIESQQGNPEYRDWYIWSETNPGYQGPWGEPAWHKAGDEYYYGVFWSGMPDLNHENPEVQAEIYDVARFWLEDMGVDGFRLDAIRHIIEEGELQSNTPSTREWLINFQEYLQSVDPEVFTVGEIFDATSFQIEPLIRENAVSTAFEFSIADGIRSGASRRRSQDIARKYRNALQDIENGQFATFLTNHDQARLLTQLSGDIGRNKVAASILLTNPGIPFLYYGEEIGMLGNKPDERIRTPMHWDATETTAGFTTASEPWEALAEGYDIANVAVQTDDPDSLLNHYRQLVHLRNNHPALQTGELIPVESESTRVLSFLRRNEEEILLVLINMDDDSVVDYALSLEEGNLPDVGSAELLLGKGEVSLPEINETGGFDAYEPLAELAPYSTYVIQLGE